MSTLATNAITDASGGSTATINGYTPTLSNMAGRNRIINGDMRIDQRNAGAAVTVNANAYFYTLDRFAGIGENTDGVFTIQQDSSAPSGFSKSLKVTVTTADTSLGATQFYNLNQLIEGYNVSDFGFGTASAKSITLSFWVKSSVTGVFGGSFRNNALTANYAFTYTINSANTWEYKTVTITGETSAVWESTNGIGLRVSWSLGSGSDKLYAAGSWLSTGASSASGAIGETNLMATSGATFYITGVQLEAGSVATPFEHRQYGQELALCERYLERCQYSILGYGATGAYISAPVNYRQVKRVTPTLTETNEFSSNVATVGFPYVNSTYGMSAYLVTASTGSADYRGLFFASAEL